MLRTTLHTLTSSKDSQIDKAIVKSFDHLKRETDTFIEVTKRYQIGDATLEDINRADETVRKKERNYNSLLEKRDDEIELLREKKNPKLEKEIRALKQSSDKLKQKASLYKKTIWHEKAKKAKCIRSAKSWGACAIGMIAVAVVGFIVANGVTFGAASGIAVGVAVVAVISSMVRNWWMKRENYEENLKRAFGEGKPIQDRIDNLDLSKFKAIYGFDFQKAVSHDFFKSKKSMKTYLEEMQFKDPEKADKLITALENGDEGKDLFLNTLKEKRNSLPGSTEGKDLFNALASHSLQPKSK